jgi:hypothetical protein
MEGAKKPIPSYRVPGVELVEEAIRSILDEAFTVRSQRLFRRLVMSKLKDMDGDGFKISPVRLRRIAARMEDVDLIVHCREGERAPNRSICPVCGSRMKDIKNSTLYGWTVPSGKACTTCSYWFGSRNRIPTRYVFTVEKERYLLENRDGK